MDRFRAHRPAPRIRPQDLEGLDALVGIVSTDLLNEYAEICDLPVFHVTDATPKYLRETYGWDIPPAADQAERCLAKNATRVVYSSAFMAARAPWDLNLPGLRAEVLPFGINLDDTPLRLPEPPSLTEAAAAPAMMRTA